MHLLLRPELLSRLKFSIQDGRNHYVQATAQQRARRALPEEIIRQLFVLSLLHDYKYPEDRIHLEWRIQVGSARKRADIVILDENDNVFVIIEIKVETDQHSMAQLKSYMTITGAQYGALVSASDSEMQCIRMRSAREVFPEPDIPLFHVTSPSFTDILPKTTAEDSTLPNDRQMRPEGTAKASQELQLKQLIGIEHFERVSKTLANITIKGSTLRLPIGEIDSYRRLRKRFMDEGIPLPPEVGQAEWSALFSHLLESNPVPEEAMAPKTSVSILVKYLNAHIGERLVVTGSKTGTTVQNARPLKELSQRYEEDTDTIWVSREHIRKYLGPDYKRTRDDLITRDVLLDANVKKTLGAGTNYGGGPIVCWMIRANHPALGALISEQPS